MNRRMLLLGGLSAMIVPAATRAMQRGATPFFSQPGVRLGLQMGVVGQEMQKAPVETLKHIYDIGYRAVEISVGSAEPELLRKRIADAGLTCTSAMVGGGRVNLSNPGAVVESANKLGVTDVVLSALVPPGGFNPTGSDLAAAYLEVTQKLTADDFRKTADTLNAQGRELAKGGVRLSYHNHNFELRRFGDLTGLEIMLRNTDPSLVSFEMDVGWVTTAGLDPVQLLQKYKGRFTQMHMKEVAKDTPRNTAMKINAAPVGQGLVNWARILPAAHRLGIKRFYVEQDAPFTIPRMQMVEEAQAFLSKVRAA